MNPRELARELLAILQDSESLRELVGALRELAATPAQSRACWPTARIQVALRLARERGAVSSGELARQAGVSQETARLTLADLVAHGRLVAEGERRGRVYRAVEPGREYGTELGAG